MVGLYIVEGLLPGGKSFNVLVQNSPSVSRFKQIIFSRKLIHPCGYYLTTSGVCLDDDGILPSPESHFMVLKAHYKLCGGKGGFGTLIRAMGTQVNKGSRKGACRDLSGRRMRDVDAEKKVAQWMSEEPERNRKRAENKRKKHEQRRSEPKHYYDDSTYMDQIKKTEENMDVSLQQGIQAVAAAMDSKGKKRKSADISSGSRKKQKMWVGLDDEHSDLEESDSNLELESSEDSGDYLQGCGSMPIDLVVQGSSLPSCSTKIGCAAEWCVDKIGNSETICKIPGTEATALDDQTTADADKYECAKEITVEKAESLKDATITTLKVVNVEDYSSVEDLMSVGGDQLKHTLQLMGLKCGGTLLERAERLFSIKGKSREEIDPSIFSKGGKQKRKK